nr:HAMP domain-containing sensor histidine kinase [Nocardioides panaciterrulae]
MLAAALVAVALVVASLALVATLDRSVVTNGDGLARSRVSDLAVLARHGDLPAVLAAVGGNGVAQAVTAGGRVLAASPNVRSAGPITGLRPPLGAPPEVHTLRGAPDDNQTEDYRVWVQTAPSPDGPVTIVAGSSLESVHEASLALRRALWVGTPVTVLVLGVLIWLVIGRALRPVEEIRARVESISGSALDRRVPVPRTHDEIGRLAVTMNQMLDRLEAAQRRQREFVADASHELQSPVAAIRAQVEVASAHPEGTDWPELARGILADCDQTERLLRDLLFLARHDELGVIEAAHPLDLDDLLLEEVARVRPMAAVTIVTGGVSAAPVDGRGDELRRMVRNLLENAVRHAEHRVTVTAGCVDGRARVEVLDDGNGVPDDERDRVFERFHRADPSRARDTGGTGLGLAIARTVAERHGGTLDLADSQRGARFVVELPRPAR